MGRHRVPGKEGFPAEVRRLTTHSRVWVLVTSVPSVRERRVLKRQFLARLDGRGKGTLEVDKHGVRVYLYRFPSR